MQTKILIDFNEPIICKEKILDIRPTDLDDFYLAASDFDKNNLFFVLLTSILHYEEYCRTKIVVGCVVLLIIVCGLI